MICEKTLFKEEIYRFTNYLVDTCGIKYISIARAIRTQHTTKIKRNIFGYNTAVKIKDAYINNYKDFKLLDK